MPADAPRGRAWLAALPDELAAQRRVMARLLDFCESTPQVTSFSVGCSLGRGAADALSDIDAAIGVTGGTDVIEGQVAAALPGLGPLVDALRHESSRGDSIRQIFAQFADRTQLDLAIVPESGIRLDERPDFVALYLVTDPPSGQHPQSAYAVTGQQVREWAFTGWTGLLDIDKYLRRDSFWEAHNRLHQVRQHIWMLWAATNGALYPWHGLSQVLDKDPRDVPPGIAETIAVLDAADLRRAAQVSAQVLAEVSRAAARRVPADLPEALAAYVTEKLTPAIA
jgi:hypothetical protein